MLFDICNQCSNNSIYDNTKGAFIKVDKDKKLYKKNDGIDIRTSQVLFKKESKEKQNLDNMFSNFRGYVTDGRIKEKTNGHYDKLRKFQTDKNKVIKSKEKPTTTNYSNNQLIESYQKSKIIEKEKYLKRINYSNKVKLTNIMNVEERKNSLASNNRNRNKKVLTKNSINNSSSNYNNTRNKKEDERIINSNLNNNMHFNKSVNTNNSNLRYGNSFTRMKNYSLQQSVKKSKNQFPIGIISSYNNKNFNFNILNFKNCVTSKNDIMNSLVQNFKSLMESSKELKIKELNKENNERPHSLSKKIEKLNQNGIKFDINNFSGEDDETKDDPDQDTNNDNRLKNQTIHIENGKYNSVEIENRANKNADSLSNSKRLIFSNKLNNMSRKRSETSIFKNYNQTNDSMNSSEKQIRHPKVDTKEYVNRIKRYKKKGNLRYNDNSEDSNTHQNKTPSSNKHKKEKIDYQGSEEEEDIRRKLKDKQKSEVNKYLKRKKINDINQKLKESNDKREVQYQKFKELSKLEESIQSVNKKK